MEQILLYIAMAFGISTVINLILKHYGISQIIGYIATGIIIAYGFNLHDLHNLHVLQEIAEFGIVFLMFTIGLEISLEKMNSMKKDIFFNGILQVGLSSVVFYIVCSYFFHLDTKTSLIVALALSLSSTAVVLTYLKSSKEIYSLYGQKATGILIFQDIAVIPILILIGVLSSDGSSPISSILFDTFISAAITLGIFFFFGKKIISYLLHFSASSEVDELFMGSVFFIVFGASILASYMGFTFSLGAFMVGMLIAETKYHHKVEADIAPFKDIFLGLFFITVGLKVDIAMLLNNIATIVGLFIAILIIKTLVIFAVIKLNSNSSTSLKTAISISQVGEFSFVIFALANLNHLLDENISSLLVLVVILSMVATPFIMPRIQKIASFFIKDTPEVPHVTGLKDRQNHIIVCGYGIVGKFVAKHLEQYDIDYIIVDNNPKHIKEAIDSGLEAYLGDMSKSTILEALQIKNVAIVIITLDNIDKKRLICEAILKQTKDINLVVKVVSLEEKEKLKDLDISVVVDGKVEVARVLVERMMTCQINNINQF